MLLKHKAQTLVRDFRTCASGATAVEFGLIAIPFFTLIMGTISFSLFYFTQASLSSALQDASRSMRTGQFQTATGAYSGANTLPARIAVLKAAMCREMAPGVDCNAIVVLAQSNNNFGGITQPVCQTGGTLTTQTAANVTFSAGAASSVVLLTACYSWKLGPKLPFLPHGNLNDGSFLVQASVVLRVEPYN